MQKDESAEDSRTEKQPEDAEKERRNKDRHWFR